MSLWDLPRTFGCHHNMPTCFNCEWLVHRHLHKEGFMERQYTQHDAMKYADKVHDALMSGMRPAPSQLPRSLHSFLCYVNYKNNCYRLGVTPFAYERYMSLIYSDMERVI